MEIKIFVFVFVKKAYTRLNMLRKVRFKLNRYTLEKMYFSFFRPILEWVCIIAPTARYSDGPLFRRPIIPTTHYSDSPLLRRPIFPTMQNRTKSTNPWFSQVYPTGCSVGHANLDGPWPRQNVLGRKRSFYPRLYIPVQGNYDRPTWYGES